MSFVKNDNQQLTVLDSTFNLTTYGQFNGCCTYQKPLIT